MLIKTRFAFILGFVFPCACVAMDSFEFNFVKSDDYDERLKLYLTIARLEKPVSFDTDEHSRRFYYGERHLAFEKAWDAWLEKSHVETNRIERLENFLAKSRHNPVLADCVDRREAFNLIKDALDDDDRKRREHACDLLYGMIRQSVEDFGTFFHALVSPHVDVRMKAAYYLRFYNGSGFGKLYNMVMHDECMLVRDHGNAIARNIDTFKHQYSLLLAEDNEH